MAKRRTDSDGRTSGRRNFAAWLMLLLPGFMFLGLLAPAAIKVQPKAEETYGPESFRHFALRRPLQVPLTMAHAMLPQMVIVEPVFSSARYLADQAKRVFELDLKNETGKQIVLADADFETPAVSGLFDGESSDSTVLSVDLTSLWNSNLFEVIPGLVAREGFSQWDDFHGTGLVGPRLPPAPAQVPEPTTGALLALGLAGLAISGRKHA